MASSYHPIGKPSPDIPLKSNATRWMFKLSQNPSPDHKSTAHPNRLIKLTIWLCAFLFSFPIPGSAEEPLKPSVDPARLWSLCKAPQYLFKSGADEIDDETLISSDQLRIVDHQLTFTNNVQLQQQDQRLRAQLIQINESTDQLSAVGEVEFITSQINLGSQSAIFNQSLDYANFDSAQFTLTHRHLNGDASAIEMINSSQTRFVDFTYSSCDPGENDWKLTSDEVFIDSETGRGTSNNTLIYFKGIPFLYLPYFMFPIDDRRMSGMLTPILSYSDRHGGLLAIPVYLNLAPNYDATITPAYFGRRGLQLNNEFRYLGQNQKGQFDLSYLDDDLTGKNRRYQRWKHELDISDSVSSDLLYQKVSDKDFFSDFKLNRQNSSTVNHFERHFHLTRADTLWQSSINWKDYQTPDDSISVASRPYQRLPELSINSLFPVSDNQTSFQINANWVTFEREDISELRESITGNRLHLNPVLTRPFSDSWYFLNPQLEFTFSQYDLNNNDQGDDSISRNIPIFSLDSGIYLDRIINHGAWLQTLEPQIFIAHIPYQDQSEIPDFDTSLLAESYNNLFRPNRFSGFDRIGDTSQVTFGLGSRIYDNSTGKELLHAQIAQAHYLEDRQVSLNSANIPDKSKKSKIISRLTSRPLETILVTAEVAYDQELGQSTDRELSVGYRRNGLVANLEYYFDQEEELEQSVISLVYPVNDQWTVFVKRHHSIEFDRTVENLFGLAYESCCWGLKILAARTSDTDDEFSEIDNIIYLQLTLKGLSSVGRDIDQEISDSIPGYQAAF
ncbi:MAG: LPS-assembly protein [Gammaproteobacteria bacterium]